MARVGLKFRGSAILGAGVLAGLLFALFEMIAAALMQGPNSLFMPLRMIGAIVLGSAALEPTYAVEVAAVTGVLVHMVLSVSLSFAFVFAAIASPSWNVGELAVPGMAFGFIIEARDQLFEPARSDIGSSRQNSLRCVLVEC